jgi:hypothetical protein
MKIKFFLASLALVFLTSCSSDTNQPTIEDIGPATTYMPLANGNYWVYDIDSEGTLSRDSLYISNDTIINSVTYKKMKTLETPTGFFSTTLQNNGVKINGSSLVMTGTFTLPFPGLVTPIQINLIDFTFFKESAAANTPLSTSSGTLQQTVSGYPLDIQYSLNSIAQETLASYSSNGVTYPNVKKTRLVLNLKITTTSSGITATLLTDQPVLTINEYFAKNIGNVYTNTVFHYDINPTIATNFGIPATITQSQEEFLDTYHLN